jgi:hypothetical protein
MLYKREVKMKFEVGQIYFWNSNESLFAKLITAFNMKFFKQSKCIHVGIIAAITETEVLIYEALDKFKSSWYSQDWIKERMDEGKVHIGQTKEALKDVYGACESYKGIGYGWLDIIGLGLSYLFGYRLKGITGKNALICSEAVSRVIYDTSKAINIAKEFGIEYDAVTPMHIFTSKQVKILNSNGGKNGK